MNTAALTTLLLGLILPLSAHAGERVLFAFDDHSIPWQHHLKASMVPATKHPENPVLRRGPEGAPDHGHAVLCGTVIRDGERFRMWCLSCKRDDNDAQPVTAPFTAGKGGKIVPDVDGVTPDAPLTIKLLDDRDGPAAGWSGTDAATITAKRARHVVAWPKIRRDAPNTLRRDARVTQEPRMNPSVPAIALT